MAEQFTVPVELDPRAALLRVGHALWCSGRVDASAFLRRHVDQHFGLREPFTPGARVTDLPTDIADARERGLLDISDEAIYRAHNITRPTSGRGFTAMPNTPDQQCGCDSCKRYMRANARTGVATPERFI